MPLEIDNQNKIRLCVGSLPYVRVFRNNTGALPDARGVTVRYGLANGSADLIGLVAPYGRFLSIECKPEGWTGPSGAKERKRHQEQCDWRDIVLNAGGVAGFAADIEEALRLVYYARLAHGVDPATDAVEAWVTQMAAEFRERMAERHAKKRKAKK
jgi:hypothetical protein